MAEPVPRIVHQVWLGGEPFPLVLGALVDGVAYRARVAGWDRVLWSDDDLMGAFPGEWPQLRSQCCHLSQASNVARYLLIERFGGLYLDTDVELFALPETLEGAWVAGTAPGPRPRAVNPCCLAAPPGHPYIRRMVEAIESGAVDLGKHMAAGPLLAIEQIRDDVNIWPSCIWFGKRGQPGELGHHYGWGPKLKSFVRRHQLPPAAGLLE